MLNNSGPTDKNIFSLTTIQLHDQSRAQIVDNSQVADQNFGHRYPVTNDN